MRVTLLGCGTSSGVPAIGCDCDTCTSDDPKDKRLRCSCFIETHTANILIDTSPDFRQQALIHKINRIDAILYTHAHFDHIGGFDEIRGFNFINDSPIPLYLTEKTFKDLRRTFIYAFEEPEQIGGGVPMVDVNFIDTDIFKVNDVVITPIPMMHGKMETRGFKIGDFAYCTDANFIPDSSIELLRGIKILVLDALKYTKHSTHYNLEEAIEVANLIGAEQVFFTHLTHAINYSECGKTLGAGKNLAYDGLKLTIS